MLVSFLFMSDGLLRLDQAAQGLTFPSAGALNVERALWFSPHSELFLAFFPSTSVDTLINPINKCRESLLSHAHICVHVGEQRITGNAIGLHRAM